MWSSRMTVSNCSKVVIASKSTSVMQLPKASWIHLISAGLQPTIEQSLIETVTGTKHKLMDTRPDRIFVTIDRAVVD